MINNIFGPLFVLWDIYNKNIMKITEQEKMRIRNLHKLNEQSMMGDTEDMDNTGNENDNYEMEEDAKNMFMDCLNSIKEMAGSDFEKEVYIEFLDEYFGDTEPKDEEDTAF